MPVALLKLHRTAQDTEVRDARLHDARHTAATFILQAGIPDRVAQSMMGWSDAKMAKHYQHVIAPIQRDAGDRLGQLSWAPSKRARYIV